MTFHLTSYSTSNMKQQGNGVADAGFCDFILTAASFGKVRITVMPEISTNQHCKSVGVYFDIPTPAVEYLNPLDYGVELSRTKIRPRIENSQYYSRRETVIYSLDNSPEIVHILSEASAARLFGTIPLSAFLKGETLVIEISSITKEGVDVNFEACGAYYAENPQKFAIVFSTSKPAPVISSVFTREVYETVDDACETLKQAYDAMKKKEREDLFNPNFYSTAEAYNVMQALAGYLSDIVDVNQLSTHQKMPYELLDSRYKNNRDCETGYYRSAPQNTIHVSTENTAIVANSGAGKTILICKHGKSCIEHGGSCIILSPLKRDFRDMFLKLNCRKRLYSATDVLHPLFLNIFTSPLEYASSDWFSTAEMILQLLVTIGNPSESLLPPLFRDGLTALFASYPERNRNLFTFAKCTHAQMHRREYREKASLGEALRLRFSEMANQSVFFADSPNVDYEEMLSPGLTIVELDNLHPIALRQIAGVLIYSILFTAKNRTDSTTHVTVMLDESHRLLGDEDSNPALNSVREALLDSLYETRAFNMTTYLADQRLKKIGINNILNGFPNRIFMRGSMSNDISECLGGITAHLEKFRPGQGVYFNPANRGPVFFTADNKDGFETNSEAVKRATAVLNQEAIAAGPVKRFGFCKMCKNCDPLECNEQIKYAKALFEKGKAAVDKPRTCHEYMLNNLHCLHGGFYHNATKKG